MEESKKPKRKEIKGIFIAYTTGCKNASDLKHIINGQNPGTDGVFYHDACCEEESRLKT